uniref:Transposase n=1 Tax=Globodera rostochiensis TaxID=31243 RepID=A0A914HPC4_GLORO
MEKAESVKVKLEELPLKTFDEIFGDGWWDKGEAEDLKMPAPTNFGQNVHHQIDRQNTQIGQIEPNSIDQNPPLSDHSGQIKPNSTDQNPPLSDHSGQIEPNSTDQNPPLTESDHSDNAKKRKIIAKFHAMKDEFMQKGKYSAKEWVQIEEKIDKTVAKELGLHFKTIYKWKKELGQSKPNKYAHNKQNELMKRYYEIKDQTPKIRDVDIAKILNIGSATLCKWKKQFKRPQLHPNSVDGHSVEEMPRQIFKKFENSNSGSN